MVSWNGSFAFDLLIVQAKIYFQPKITDFSDFAFITNDHFFVIGKLGIQKGLESKVKQAAKDVVKSKML